MAINLEKAPLETLYYYADNGKTVGPFPLNELLPKIKADTLVYRDGIEWTNAKDVEELRTHFPEPEKKPKNSFLLLIISILLFALIGVGALIVYNKINKQEPPIVESPGGKTEPESPGNTESTTTGPKGPTESGNAPKSETGSSGNDNGTNNESETENPSPPKTEKSPASPKQVELFTCESGQNIRKALVNNGKCDCNDCSDESNN
jgi:cytoskeletal protein RodZ